MKRNRLCCLIQRYAKKTLPMKQYMLKMLIIKNGVRIAFPFQGKQEK